MNTLQFLQKNFNEQVSSSTTHLIDEIKKVFNEKNIKMYFSISPESSKEDNFTIILNQVKTLPFDTNSTNDNPMTKECAGLVFRQQKGTWTCLSQPPDLYKTHFDTQLVNKLLLQGAYDVFKIKDGTIITFYYDAQNINTFNIVGEEGKDLSIKTNWHISSSNGINVSNLKWDEKSYIQSFYECLSNMNVSMDDFLSALDVDKSQSYTFGFKHPERHPFYELSKKPIYDIWFIQSTVPASGKQPNYTSSPHSKIVAQQPVQLGNKEDLFSLFRNLTKSEEMFRSKSCVLYGYILRFKNYDVNNINSSILLESRLMAKIRKFYYYNLFATDANKFNNCSRKTYLLLYAYLSYADEFKLYFPQLGTYFDKFDIISTKLSAKVIQIALASAKLSKTSKSQGEFKVDETQFSSLDEDEKKKFLEKIFDVHAQKLYTLISSIFSIKSNNRDVVRYVLNFICDVKFIGTFINIYGYM
jgi:hypothetical protein